MGGVDIVEAFKTANMVVEWAIIAIPSLLGLGAIGSLGYGIYSTGKYWINHGGEMVKTGISIVAGAGVGAIGGLRAVGTLRSMGMDIGIGEAMKMVGSEAIKGGVKASTGSRGWLQVANRSVWGNEAEKNFLSKKPIERTIVKHPDGYKETIERREGDKTGATERIIKEKVVGPDGGPPPKTPPGGAKATRSSDDKDPFPPSGGGGGYKE